MSTCKPQDQDSIAVDQLDADADQEELVAVIADLQQRVEQLETESEQKDERISELEDDKEDLEKENEQLRERVSELEDRQADQAREAAEDRQRLTDVEDRIEEVEDAVEGDEPHPSDEEEPTPADSLTPIEELSRTEEIEDVTDSPTVERAVSLFENLPKWGSKTPKGIVLKPADNPLSLLEADRDESLAWKQYYRAAEALERLSEGAVTFFDSDRHGKMLVLHEQSEAYERVQNGALTPSSVGARG